MRKLTDEQVAYARTHIEKTTYGAMAGLLGCHLVALKRAVKGETYRHLDKDYPPRGKRNNYNGRL